MDYRHRLASLCVGNTSPVQYWYDVENRLSTVSTPAFAAEYAYTLDGWDAGYSVALANGVVLDRIVARDRYRRSLVKAITNSVNSIATAPLAYDYDKLNRVIRRNTDTFDYNIRSEVISAVIQTNHASRYAYDNIGNNHWVSVNAVTNFYAANELNQYTGIGNETIIEPEYDLDGNMTWDGRLSYTWDAENKLVAAYSNNVCVISNAYDHMSRRVIKFTPEATHTYIYDGWNLVAETIQPLTTNHQPPTTNHYVWGKDLSGTLNGAGGVGGLLAVQMDSAWYFPFYDNNGNITAYADETGAIAAEYTYDAFGRTIASTGLHADAFRHRFSTKYLDVETGFYYYGYRFYAPELMRWLNRDPLHETGFISVFLQSPEGAAAYFQAMGGVLADEELQNLCRFVMNNPLSGVDPYGLDSRFWDGMQCMADCIEDNDPVKMAIAKVLVLVAGAPIPKTVVAALAESVGDTQLARAIRLELRMPGVSPYTTIPSSLSAKLRLGGRSTLRAFGRYAQGAMVAYGLALAAVEAHCTGHCCGSRQYDPGIGNILDQLRHYFDNTSSGAGDGASGGW
jgi:RHS repeat-associated protein